MATDNLAMIPLDTTQWRIVKNAVSGTVRIQRRLGSAWIGCWRFVEREGSGPFEFRTVDEANAAIARWEQAERVERAEWTEV